MGIPQKALITGEEIKKLIPHREPMIMVDSFFGIDEGVSYSGLTVTEDNIFVENGHLSEAGVIEHIAQSAAAHAGFVSLADNKPAALGFIGAVNKCKILTLPRLNDKLFTSVKIENELFGIMLIRCHVHVDGNLTSECMMKISIQE